MILFDDIKEQPRIVIKNLYSFLNVDPNFTPTVLSKKINYTGLNKSRFNFFNVLFFKISRFYYQNKILRKLSPVLKKIGLNQIRDKIKHLLIKTNVSQKKYQKPEISSTDKQKLKDIYQNDTKQLAQLLNRSLDW